MVEQIGYPLFDFVIGGGVVVCQIEIAKVLDGFCQAVAKFGFWFPCEFFPGE